MSGGNCDDPISASTDSIEVYGGIDGDNTQPHVINVSSAGRVRQGAGVIISSVNSTTTPLAASGTFTGTGENILDYAQAVITIYGTPSTAKGSFYFEFSPDGTNWDVSVPALVRDPTFVIPVPVINVGKFFRVRYLNDGGAAAILALGLSDTAGTPTNQTVFRLTTYFFGAATKELTRTLDQTIQGSDPAALTRSVTMGLAPDGSYHNLAAPGVSSGNSSTTPLLAGATFTGVFDNIDTFAQVGIILYSDQLGATTNALQLEWSSDGSTIDRTTNVQAISVTSGEFVAFPRQAKYVRVKYTNGGTNQGAFRLHTFYTSNPLGLKLTPLNDTVNDSSASALGRSGIIARDSSGSWGNVPRRTLGGLAAAIDSLSSIKATQQTITTAASQVTSTPLTNRRSITVKNSESNGVNDLIWIGHNSSVTSGNGFCLGRGASLTMEVDTTASIYAISNVGGGAILCIVEAGE